ncbi:MULTISPECIES: S8 family serine peptidase [unclassified Bradyrhizobium]|uniref:S8 family serine peptidase n=1 Tax=unclassified Bradyrhizobium TaxID=2631580 RepID=UPI0028E6C425|nr:MULTISPECIES: S8 family serine peptidase [unclassified Bradyrhizobium]
MADNNASDNSAGQGKGSNGRGNAAPNKTDAAAPTVEPTVKARRSRFLVAARPLPGVQPMAVDAIATTLNNMPDVQIIKQVKPSGFGAFSAGGGGGGMPEIVVAEMDPARGAALRASAPPNVIVEHDALLRHADDLSMAFNNAMTMSPGIGIDVRLRVVGTSGQPLPKATVYVYGLGFPGQGVTDDKGEVTVTVFGGPLETIQAIYVKPSANYWDRMFERPALSDGINTLQLQPFSATFQGFPGSPYVGWGQQLMKLDQLDPSLTGQGVKVAIIDSGCDSGHPQLTHVTRGMDFTNNKDGASWARDTMSHGTHCAGIITAATSGQLKAVRGFAPMAEVHALKVFPGGRFSDLIDALDQCIASGIDVVNMSLGSSEASELVAHKLIEARQNGVACIVAAGNASGPVQFPGNQPSVLTVSAIGKLGEFPDDSYHARTVVPNMVAGAMFSPRFTCFGPQIGVAGPGVAIVSTVPGGGYAAWDGTSMATPHITGMGALLLAHHPVFRDAAKARNEQRVSQLFSLLASAGVRYLGDPTREGVGVPDLQRVAGLGTAAQSGNMATASAAPPLGGTVSFGVPYQGSPFANAYLQPAQMIHPALLQSFLQMRNAGLV